MPFSDLTPGNEIAGGTDGTPIGNVSDKLKVTGDFTGTVSEVVNGAYVSGNLLIGSTQVEAKVGATRLPNRKMLLIYNPGGAHVYYGASGVTTSNGIELPAKGFLSLPVGDNVAVFMIKTGSNQTIQVQEFA